MNQPYTSPGYRERAFHCPNCHVFADQLWQNTFARPINVFAGNVDEVPGMLINVCAHCHRYCIWMNGEMVFPESTGVQPANEDLPEDIIRDYDEAAGIVQKSPRGAAALLRLAIQKICAVLGEKGKKIDDDIKALVAKGLPVQVQQALDIVRVTGNEAVHPGTMDLRDDPETATQLFGLVNIIADIMITQPKHVAAMYSALPEEKLKGIEQRGKTK